jgi:hypothetical protein
MDPAARRTAGISESLLRQSVGLELGEDLVHDLTTALDRSLDHVVPGDEGHALETHDVAVPADGCDADRPELAEVSA